MALSSRVYSLRKLVRFSPRLCQRFQSNQVSKSEAFWDEEGSVEVTKTSSSQPLIFRLGSGSRGETNQAAATFPSDFVRITKFGHVRLDSDNSARPTIPIEPQYESAPHEENEDESEEDIRFSFPLVDESPNDGGKKKANVDKETAGEALKPQITKPASALEYMRQLKQKSNLNDGKILEKKTGVELKFDHPVDSKGFKTYSHLIPNLNDMTHDMIVSFLKKSIIYKDNGIVAIDKPYGMAVMDAEAQKARHVLTEYLPDLGKLLRCEKLYTVHRLDRDTTGVLLLATDQKTANKIHEMFQRREVMKIYWAITKGQPEPKQGTINIPIAEAEIAGKKRMKIRPVLPSDVPNSAQYNAAGKSFKAVTQYNTIKTSGSAALVELQPETGTRHQLRVHLSEALNCPILGDHKYSHKDKFAPQKLPQDMLEGLGVRQTKVRTIPMHLHAKKIILPSMGPNDSQLVISANLPLFFRKSISALKLSPRK